MTQTGASLIRTVTRVVAFQRRRVRVGKRSGKIAITLEASTCPWIVVLGDDLFVAHKSVAKFGMIKAKNVRLDNWSSAAEPSKGEGDKDESGGKLHFC